ncbi:MAG TPA: GyrI-like domain-containing protein [Fimbriimonadaceae bacterium]
MTVEIKKLGPHRVVAMRHVGDYRDIGAVFQRLMAWADINDITPGKGLSIFYDDPNVTSKDLLRSDACFIVDPYFLVNDISVKVVDIPEQTCAVTEHVGSYEGLPASWGKFMDWFTDSGKRFAEGGTIYEFYENNNMQGPPEELRTLLVFPVHGD